MTQDNGFWTWPVDLAAARSKSRGLAIASMVLYALGAAMLLVQTMFHLPMPVAEIGVVAILLGLTASVVVVGKVLFARSRLSFH